MNVRIRPVFMVLVIAYGRDTYAIARKDGRAQNVILMKTNASNFLAKMRESAKIQKAVIVVPVLSTFMVCASSHFGQVLSESVIHFKRTGLYPPKNIPSVVALLTVEDEFFFF